HFFTARERKPISLRPKVDQKLFLDRVSTGSGSDLINDQHSTHGWTRSLPLPVPTRSKMRLLLLRQSQRTHDLDVDDYRPLFHNTLKNVATPCSVKHTSEDQDPNASLNLSQFVTGSTF